MDGGPDPRSAGEQPAGPLLVLVDIGALLSAIRPVTQSAIGAWVAITLGIIGVGNVWSAVVQQHTGVADAC